MIPYDELTEQEQELVDLARENDGIVTFEEAGQVYSRRERAKAFRRLAEKGWAESVGFGAVRIEEPDAERQTFLGEDYAPEAEP